MNFSMQERQATAVSAGVAVLIAVAVAVTAFGGVSLGANLFTRTTTVTRTETETSISTSTLIQTVTLVQTTTSTVTVSVTTTPSVSLLPTCSAYGSQQQSTSCSIQSPTAGDFVIVAVSDVPPVTVSDTQGNQFTEIGRAQSTSTYYVILYYTMVKSSNPDSISISGGGNFPSLVVHQMAGVRGIGSYSTGSGDSANPSVAPYVPTPGSYVYAVVQARYEGAGYGIGSGSGYAEIGVYPGYLADELLFPASGSTTSPFAMTSPEQWGEVSVSLLP